MGIWLPQRLFDAALHAARIEDFVMEEQGRAEASKQAQILLERTARKGGAGKVGANPFGESNDQRLHGFGAVHKTRGTVMQTEPMLKKHGA